MQFSPAHQERYQAIATDLRAAVAAYPPALRAGAEPFLAKLLAGEFSRLAALLPAYLTDLAPVPPAAQHALGVAALWLWWYAAAFDGVLDGALAPAVLPAAQQALLQAMETYRALGLAATPAWADLHARALTSAAAYAVELAARAPRLPNLSDAQLAAWTPELLMDRAAPFGFTAVAQLELAGIPAAAPLSRDMPLALRHLTAARQLSDDASDWLDDLRADQLNAVAAGLIRHILAERPDARPLLSVEWLAGHQLVAEKFWAAIEGRHAEQYRQATALLAPYGPCALSDLIAAQARIDAGHWAARREQRAAARGLFGLNQ